MRANPAAVKALREMAGFQQAELARLSGIGRSYLNEIESGSKPGTPGVLKRIAAALKCPLPAILSEPAVEESVA